MLSLRNKFFAVITGLLVFTIVAYMVVAVKLFNDDKRAYVFDGSLMISTNLANETKTTLQGVSRTLNLVAKQANKLEKGSAAAKDLIVEAFNADADIVDLRILRREKGVTKNILRLSNSDYLKPYNLDETYFDRVHKDFPIPFQELKSNSIHISNTSIVDSAPLLSISFSSAELDNLITVAYLRLDNSLKIFSRSKVYDTYLINKYGLVLAHKDLKQVLRHKSVAGSSVLDQILKSTSSSGVNEIVDDGATTIVGYSHVDFGDLLVVSEIKSEKAFLASARLVEKSIVIAGLLLLAGLFISFFFTKGLTSTLARVVDATRQIAEGHFEIHCETKSRDEVGVLAKSVNIMAEKISSLLEKTKESVRMEQELETAKIVQENFFPVDKITVGDINISSFYQSASECGGDWWGEITIGSKLFLFIGDATGHGVPAALITSAVQSCVNTIECSGDAKQLADITPAKMMNLLNKTVCKSGKGKIKMTFFIAMMEPYKETITVCNASHPYPILSRSKEGDPSAERSKSSLSVLKSETCVLLGAEIDSEYVDTEAEISDEDVLVFYTDGFLEGYSPSGKMYGKGRFIKSIFPMAHETPSAIREKMLSDAFGFFEDVPPDDDLTLVVLKKSSAAQSVEIAS